MPFNFQIINDLVRPVRPAISSRTSSTGNRRCRSLEVAGTCTEAKKAIAAMVTGAEAEAEAKAAARISIVEASLEEGLLAV